jgi:hypothetical protein
MMQPFIPLPIQDLFLLALVIPILLLAGLWIAYALRSGERPPPRTRARIYRCAVCAHVYVDTRNVPLSRCARCGCLNEAVRR